MQNFGKIKLVKNSTNTEKQKAKKRVEVIGAQQRPSYEKAKKKEKKKDVSPKRSVKSIEKKPEKGGFGETSKIDRI